jgi:uncharacterized protein (TIGR00375 family)
VKFIADLHVHSKFSRATAKNLDLENLYIAARIKGVTVVGTGDFTYPAWFSEICEKLEPAEPGLFKLKSGIATACDEQVPDSCRGTVRFILSTEISNIYKKNDRTRKNHNLVLMPDLEVAKTFNAKLDRIGNIQSDGRPILGLDARNLLEILLETSSDAYLIPAHIWTPWFSVLGSKSGFDSIKECFDDLTPHIFAVETGLSSDPPMNWRVSALDGLTLVSNSDAHSPFNLGREANLLNTELSYDGIKAAIRSGDPTVFPATFEFYPEEGKYHLDGHRKCNICLRPEESRQYDGKCPVCGKPLTLGVLYRVEELADRRQGNKPAHHHTYSSIISLAHIFSEILRVGAKSKKVQTAWKNAIHQLGDEFAILHFLPIDQIEKAQIPLLGEAIRRMRQNEIEMIAGYDGQYGQVKIFNAYEREQLLGQKALFSGSALPVTHSPSEDRSPVQSPPVTSVAEEEVVITNTDAPTPLIQLNDQQRRAVEHPGGALLIVAGPGTGKTFTLTRRVARLVMEKNVSTDNILAVTFTNKAAQEMHARLHRLMGDGCAMPLVATFHSFCYRLLKEEGHDPGSIISEDYRRGLIADARQYLINSGTTMDLNPRQILQRIQAAKQQILLPEEFEKTSADMPKDKQVLKLYRSYRDMLAIQGLSDYEDLIFNIVRLFETDPSLRRKYRLRFEHIFVDEYQDLNQGQYRIIRALAPDESSIKDLCVIGDPDQAIYGFRGSDAKYFNRFVQDYPGAGVIHLTRNYRSSRSIVDASFQVIENHRHQSSDVRTYTRIDGVKTIGIVELAGEKAEARAVADIIQQQIGGTGFHSFDTGIVEDAHRVGLRGYADFAVLYRTNGQHRLFADIFRQWGIPFQVASRQRLLDAAGMPQIVSFLKLVEQSAGYLDYQNVVVTVIPGIGQKTVEKFQNWCYANKFSLQQGMSQAVRFPIAGLKSSRQQQLNVFYGQLQHFSREMSTLTVADKLLYLEKNTALSDILNRDEDVKEAFVRLVDMAAAFGTCSADFFTALALYSDSDALDPAAEKVSLMTMHTAKGLEFPVVFIVGCEQDFIPYKRPDHSVSDVAEERRLFYVAMTRAREQLYLTAAKKRRIYGKLENRRLSSFVADIEDRLKQNETSQRKKKGGQAVQMKLF